MNLFQRTVSRLLRLSAEPASLTEQVLQARAEAAAVSTGPRTAAGVKEFIRGVYARAFSGLEVTNVQEWTNLAPDVLSAVGTRLVRDGRACLNVPGEIVVPEDFKKTGSDICIYFAPDGTKDNSKGALQALKPLLDLLDALEACHFYEHRGSVGHLLTVPEGTGETELTELTATLRTLAGRTALVESTRGGWGEGARSSPSRDWEARRIGPEVPASEVSLLETLSNAAISAAGIPISLYGNATGPESREAWRFFVASTIRPYAQMLQARLRLRDEQAIVSTDSLGGEDLLTRSRAVKALVDAGLSIEDATRTAGLSSERE